MKNRNSAIPFLVLVTFLELSFLSNLGNTLPHGRPTFLANSLTSVSRVKLIKIRISARNAVVGIFHPFIQLTITTGAV